jgi:hypothetical protein
MKTLIVKDLAIAAELDSKSMSAVRGGRSFGGGMASYMQEYPQYPASSSTTTVSVSQVNNQSQFNPTGNGSAVFGGGIAAYNNQQGANVAGSYYPMPSMPSYF